MRVVQLFHLRQRRDAVSAPLGGETPPLPFSGFMMNVWKC